VLTHLDEQRKPVESKELLRAEALKNYGGVFFPKSVCYLFPSPYLVYNKE